MQCDENASIDTLSFTKILVLLRSPWVFSQALKILKGHTEALTNLHSLLLSLVDSKKCPYLWWPWWLWVCVFSSTFFCCNYTLWIYHGLTGIMSCLKDWKKLRTMSHCQMKTIYCWHINVVHTNLNWEVKAISVRVLTKSRSPYPISCFDLCMEVMFVLCNFRRSYSDSLPWEWNTFMNYLSFFFYNLLHIRIWYIIINNYKYMSM